MAKLFATFLSGIGVIASASGSTACTFVWLDEPEMPKSMIER